MKKGVLIIAILSACLRGYTQSFQLLDKHDNFTAGLNEQIRIPIRIKNTSDKPYFFAVRKVVSELGDSQKGYFCLDNNCLEPGIDEFSKRIEAGETLKGLYFIVESGLQSIQSHIKLEIFAKGRPQDTQEINANLIVDEKPGRNYVFHSKEITIHEVFPNPVQNEGFMDYQIHQEQTKAKIVIHNILGKPMGEYDLSFFETRVKIAADELASGIYFYTLYLDNTGVATRKMIVRK